MDNMNYPPNSHKYKQAQESSGKKKEIKKVVKGSVKTKKKSEITKFGDIFLAEDWSTVKTYLVGDVLIPGAKKIVYDLFIDGLGMFLGMGSRGNSSNRPTGSYISYRNNFSDRRDDRPSGGRSYNTRNVYDIDNVYLDSRGDAEQVLMQMDDSIREYGTVSVADFYDLVGISHNNYMAHKYGWINLQTAEVIRTSDGYKLKLPKALPIN